ncbi:hypothetical protein [Nocardioides sp. MH1]|uniref:hypothetical protein n=1 Tax=Nocardioides sp. MH1 TaxID=3242490 RepID=UPI00351F85D2
MVLHVGTGKTGTTSIQDLFRLNRAAFGERGILYPRTPGMARHLKLGLSFRSDEEYDAMPAWHHLRAQEPQHFRRRFHRRLLHEIASAAPERVVFSDEAIYALPGEALRRMRVFLAEHFGPVHVIVYLRRQDDHLVSFYQQQVKVGETRRIAEFAAAPTYPYDYARQLAELRETLQPDAMTVRRFERDRFVGGRLEDDFLEAAGIEDPGLQRGRMRNQSLDATTVEFLRIFNLHEVEHAGAVVGVMDHRDLVRVLEERSAGPQLTLPEAVLDDFMARWDESNRSVAEQWFGEPTLFAPRRRGQVTEAQEIDATALEELMQVAGFPEDVRERMRDIAQRESLRSAQ